MIRYSLEAYRSILRTALESGYEFAPFDADARRSRTVHLRHDVDYSPTLAVQMAEVNAACGVRGTFFVLLRSQVYNFLAEPTLALIRRLVGLGQDVAFHAALPAVAPPEMGEFLAADFATMKAALPELSPVFAWHNPTAEILTRFESEPSVGGLINAYSRSFFREIPYYSDSNLRHPVETFLHVVGLAGPPIVQLGFHPLNWAVGGATMLDIFAGAWDTIVRERELEFRTNASYSRMMPEGMPSSVLRMFVEQWKRAADAETGR
jgi:hypothetical protein